ncbi:hypothetical protein R1sor_017892 [Riccia sorocarpa]|uniref:NADP-dependent oxidoreductase domain-containing protein n=1 Tax=Riccia sorocarpa TaxID=122646 RepID=A0ABD3I841_9MARC
MAIVPTVPLRSQGLELSAQSLVCMGMSAFYGTPKPDEEMIERIHKAVEHGVTLLDTSDMYGPYTNEILVGKQFLLVFVSARYLNSVTLMKIV